MADSSIPPRRGPLQGARGIALIVAGSAIFVGLASFVILAVLAAGESAEFSGCTPADKRPIVTLERLQILRRAPDGAAFRELRSGCDTSDQFAWAEAVYSYDGPQDEAVAFYQKEAASDGWILKSQNPDPSVGPSELAIDVDSLCFSKDLGGFVAYLSLTFARNIPVNAPETNDYWWGVRANGVWC